MGNTATKIEKEEQKNHTKNDDVVVGGDLLSSSPTLASSSSSSSDFVVVVNLKNPNNNDGNNENDHSSPAGPTSLLSNQESPTTTTSTFFTTTSKDIKLVNDLIGGESNYQKDKFFSPATTSRNATDFASNGENKETTTNELKAKFMNKEGETVSSEDEEEVVLFCQPAKLYVFGEPLSGGSKQIWQNRGRGECRIQRNNSTTMTLRLLMRQDRTGEIVANHSIDPRIELELSEFKPDRSWVWSLVSDDSSSSSEGDNETTTTTKYGIRFDDVQVADDFQTKFLESQNEMEKLMLLSSDAENDDGIAGRVDEDDVAEA